MPTRYGRQCMIALSAATLLVACKPKENATTDASTAAGAVATGSDSANRARTDSTAMANKGWTDGQILAFATVANKSEIAEGKLATTKATNPKVKAFARQMVTDHTKTSSELKGLVGDGKVQATLPTALDSSHQSKLDKLKGATGKDFSSDYDSYQVSAHEDAVSLFERYAKGGDNTALKDWAGKTLPALKHHLDMAKELGKAPSIGQSK